jgi:hypothetical protein
MGHGKIFRGSIARASLCACTLTAFLLAFSSAAVAGGPFHVRAHSLDITTNLNHACGAAVDSKGDFYAASAGDSKIKVYNSSHTLLAEISDANQPCGLAVTTTGNLYVSERATGEVVRFKPNVYPFVGTPTYEPREVIDSSTKAKGIAVDRFDNRLYVAEGNHVAVYKADGGFEANLGEGTLTEATGVAAYTYSGAETTNSYLWVADAKGILADRLYLFADAEGKTPVLRGELTGATTPDGSLEFGAAGAYLAADPGNRSGEKCVKVAEQACSAGHLFLYDAGHKALDEFDASGQYLDRTANAAFADAEPTAIAIDRSGGSNDGTVYVTAGAGAGAKALAFGPLTAPKREALLEPLSHELEGARAVATDSHGDVYAGTGGEIHIYGPNGNELTTPIESEDIHEDMAVDSAGKVYVLDKHIKEPGKVKSLLVSYYIPSKYPPDSETIYSLHESVVTGADFPKEEVLLRGIAVNPGPGSGKDRLYVTTTGATHVYDSAAKESKLLDSEFAKGLTVGFLRQSLAVNGATGTVYIGVNGSNSGVFAIDETGKKLLAHFDSKGSPSGESGANPLAVVDQSNGHVIEYDGVSGTVHEYDAAGNFVTEFGSFTKGLTIGNRVAVDNACSIHLNGKGAPEPLDETTTPTCKAFDPADGNVYVAFDDTSPKHPPFDVSAFGRLDYGPTPPTPEYELTVKKGGEGSGEVTSEGKAIKCGSICTAKFKEDITVTLTAKADPENEFLGWSGCEKAETVSKTEGTCQVWMSQARDVEAEFKPPTGEEFPLEVEIEGPGSGKVTSSPAGIDCPLKTCIAKFIKGVKVTLTAEEDEGSKFAGWTGCDAEPSAKKCEVLISGLKKVKVKFKVEAPLLTVVKKGAGSGTVTGGSVAEPSTINCGTGSGCKHEYKLGAEVTLEAKADKGFTFREWGGACSGKEPVCIVTMSKAKEVAATFDALPQAKAKQTHPILYNEATLRGEVDPSGLATKYHFEYLTEEEYEANEETFEGAQSTPIGELAAGKGFVVVEATLTGLGEGTEYRFRLLAQNSVGLAQGEGEEEGSFETLQRRLPQTCPNTAYRFGLSANLPDCRAYELVTPAQTNGSLPYAASGAGTLSGIFSNWLTVQRGLGAAGERLSYFVDGTLPGFEGNGRFDGYRAERGAGGHPTDGWQSTLFSPDYTESAPGILHLPSQHGVAPDQLYSIWEIDPEPETFPETRPKGAYLQTPAGFEVLGQGSLGEDLGALSRYVSADGAHVIFVSKEHLEEGAAPKGTEAIYDRTAGEASGEVVSVKPGGSSFTEGATYLGATEDGSAVTFSVGGVLYLHREGETTEIATSPNTFAGFSGDGMRVFYVDSANGASAAGLFACDTEAGPCAGSGAHSPTKIATAGIFAAVSSDGARAFFSSTEALTGGEENDNGEEAEAGDHNLYVWDDTGVHLIGRLPALDFEKAAFGGPSEMNLAGWTRAVGFAAGGSQSGRMLAPTRSTPSGGAFAFQSHARLTAYDNEGVGEIYRYDPTAEEGERLLCVSCDPSGAPPSTNAQLEDVSSSGSPLNRSTMIANLTDSGDEVFFQSFDRLLPEDANDAEDVYEWRAKGSGAPECTRPGGCLALISSGQGETPTFLYAMSADGRDVFIHTKEKLVGADVAGSPSIYDARAGGGIPEPTPTAPCQGDACQGTGTEPPVIPSATSTGAGEGGPSGGRPPCVKGKHRVKGRCVPVRHHKHHRRHHRAHANRGGNR